MLVSLDLLEPVAVSEHQDHQSIELTGSVLADNTSPDTCPRQVDGRAGKGQIGLWCTKNGGRPWRAILTRGSRGRQTPFAERGGHVPGLKEIYSERDQCGRGR